MPSGKPLYIPRMRFWFALLLTLSFALQGWAAVRPSDAPCPMGMGTEMAAGMELPGAAAEFADDGGCCNDMASYLASGQLCKTGQDCQAPATALLVVQRTTTRTVASQSVPLARSPATPLPVANAVWRPPTSP